MYNLKGLKRVRIGGNPGNWIIYSRGHQELINDNWNVCIKIVFKLIFIDLIEKLSTVGGEINVNLHVHTYFN